MPWYSRGGERVIAEPHGPHADARRRLGAQLRVGLAAPEDVRDCAARNQRPLAFLLGGAPELVAFEDLGLAAEGDARLGARAEHRQAVELVAVVDVDRDRLGLGLV